MRYANRRKHSSLRSQTWVWVRVGCNRLYGQLAVPTREFLLSSLLFGLIALALAPFWSAARAFMRPYGAPKAVLLAPFWAVKWTRRAWSARILRLAVVLCSLRLAEIVCFDILC